MFVCIVWASDFVLPNVPVGVDETVELINEDNELVRWSVLLVEEDGVWNSVTT